MTQPSNSDKAIAILQGTEDGNKLTPSDLSLVQSAANNQLTERGQEVFAALYQTVLSGEYTDPASSKFPWFHGILHLTKDHQGYVYWKGKQVEHYSFQDRDKERAAAERLAANCQALEAKGFPVTARTAIGREFQEAPADTPWLRAMTRFYMFFDRGQGRTIGVFYRYCDNGEPFPVVSAYKENGEVKSTLHVGAYEAFHELEARLGAVKDQARVPHESYADIVDALEKTGMSPAEVNGLIGEPL